MLPTWSVTFCVCSCPPPSDSPCTVRSLKPGLLEIHAIIRGRKVCDSVLALDRRWLSYANQIAGIRIHFHLRPGHRALSVRDHAGECFEAAHHRALVRLRRKLRGFRKRNNRTPRVIGLRELFDERLRRACHQRKLHIVPVLADGVVHDGPTLQQRLVAGL